MNPLIFILFLFAAAAALDKFFGNRLKLGEEFDKGLALMGPLSLSMVGLYCFSTLAGQKLADLFGERAGWFLDPSVLVGCVLSSDIGAYAVSEQIAATPEIAAFSGLLLASVLGSTLSFALPATIGSVRREDTEPLLTGTAYGILTIPIGLVPGGLLAGLSARTLLFCLLPVLLFSLALACGIRFRRSAAVRAVGLLGRGMQALSILLFLLTAVGIFWELPALADPSRVSEILLIILRVTVVICGSLAAVSVLLRLAKKPILRLSQLLGVNEYAVAGLLMTTVTSLAMAAVFERMDRRGKVFNAAFAVSGAFVFGGQLAFVSAAREAIIPAYVLSKLIGGITAGILALCLCPRTDPSRCAAVLQENQS